MDSFRNKYDEKYGGNTDMFENKINTAKVQISRIVAIGASTGGPKALQEIIPVLPESIKAPVLVVQHMPQGFTKILAERLNNLSMVTVKEAEENDILRPGYVYIAPGNYHLNVIEKKDSSLRIRLSKEEPVEGHRPSVNKMFCSLAEIKAIEKIAVILTGMGRDGTDGLLELKKSGKVYTIAQNESTSVIYGMPKSAVEAGVVDIVLPLGDISAEIIKCVGV